MTNSSHPVGPIVVAVDGSPESAAALAWAHDHAAVRRCGLRVVTAFEQPYVGNDAAGAYLARYEAAEQAARAHAAETVSAVLGHDRVDHVVAVGPIERLLTDHAQDASMIVVGTRATDSWLARLRGSVTDRLTGQMHCPVVSVPLAEPALAAAAA